MSTIQDIMTRDVATTSPDATTRVFGQRLLDLGIGGMPVVDADGKLVGMASDFDVIGKPGGTVAEIMTRGVVTIEENASPSDVVTLMGLHGIRRVPVCADGRLLGVVGRVELLREWLGRQQEQRPGS